MQSILVVVNKHNNAIVASCWFIIHYSLVMHGNSDIKIKNEDCYLVRRDSKGLSEVL